MIPRWLVPLEDHEQAAEFYQHRGAAFGAFCVGVVALLTAWLLMPKKGGGGVRLCRVSEFGGGGGEGDEIPPSLRERATAPTEPLLS